MFNAWKAEKATAALVEAAEDLAEKLSGAKQHILDSHAATARYWLAAHLAEGQDLRDLANWPPVELDRFLASATTRIAALRKKRDYDLSDGLTVWLHTARAVLEPRIAPAVRQIWGHLRRAGPNTETMALDQMAEAGLQPGPELTTPLGFAPDPDED